MLKLINPEDMRTCEANYFASGAAASIDIMENAAEALAKSIRRTVPGGASIRFACGPGGNGGDGTACARLLKDSYRCAIVLLKEPSAPDAVLNLRRARELGIPVYTPAEESLQPRPHCWVDALFGTGFTGEPRADAARLIARINKHRSRGSYVISADIPSGLNGRTGRAAESCVSADLTVTFGWRKPGQVLADGLDVCGSLECADVGFPQAPFDKKAADLVEQYDCRALLPDRPRNIYKNRCGHLLVVAGSTGMAGAALMCVRAALRCGVGLVTVACPEPVVPILQTGAPQAMCVPLPAVNGVISEGAAPILHGSLAGKTAAVIGCGLTCRVPAEIMRTVLEAGIPTVVDADALNLLASAPSLLTALHERCVLTPHPGEAARLLHAMDLDPALLTDPVAAAQALRVNAATVLLKGAASVVAGKDTYISASGCAGMARGGSGDILSGMLGALLADPAAIAPDRLAALTSELHGLAGEAAQARYGERCMNAADLLELLPEAFRCGTSR